jgi:PTH1 family peptidyl-tRNA hydrolase
VKIGIGRPPGRQDPAAYVLEPLRSAALEQLTAMTPHAAQAVIHILEHGVESAMREYNAG